LLGWGSSAEEWGLQLLQLRQCGSSNSIAFHSHKLCCCLAMP
jgi:hypothetical protein